MKIDREYLLSLSPQPCESGLAAFDAAFPDGLLVEGDLDDATLEKLAKLNVDWFAHTLPTEARTAYLLAVIEMWGVYDRVDAEAWSDYHRALADALVAYGHGTAEARDSYDRAVIEARAVYDRDGADALAAFRRDGAAALWRIVADMEVPS